MILLREDAKVQHNGATKLRIRKHDIRCGTTLPNYAHLGAFDFL